MINEDNKYSFGSNQYKSKIRKPSEEKVNEIANSISNVGLLSPVGLDASKNLIYGMHRLMAFQKLGKKTIPSIIHDSDPKMNELKNSWKIMIEMT